MARTYLDACLKDGLPLRWASTNMPLLVYIAPFRWYEKTKQGESYAYNQMIIEALQTWSQVSEGRISFQQVPTLNDSQMDIKWRRVDRKSLGHCVYNWDKENRIYSAEIEIGISDGLLHARYNDMDEVKHTILHEIGHALGLVGHSPYGDDIMYVPHQYGVTSLSARDVETIKCLYDLPLGYDYKFDVNRLGLPQHTTIDELVAHQKGWKESVPQAVKSAKPAQPEDPAALERQQELLYQRGLFYLQTSHLMMNDEGQTG